MRPDPRALTRAAVFCWFVGTAIVTVWFVFRDPRFDHRLLLVGAVLPPLVDAWSGGAWVMHSLVANVALLTLVMVATLGRRPIRRTLLGLPLGTLLHLVFTGAWSDAQVFWWPFLGTSFGDASLPIVARGWWNLLLEALGVAMMVWVWRAADLGDAAARRRFMTTGVLALPAGRVR